MEHKESEEFLIKFTIQYQSPTNRMYLLTVHLCNVSLYYLSPNLITYSNPSTLGGEGKINLQINRIS